MNERKPGWYWCRVDEDAYKWACAYWCGEHLWIEGGAYEIGPRIPTPDEPWATVPVQPDDAMIDAAFWAWGSTDVRSVYIDMISSAPKPEDT